MYLDTAPLSRCWSGQGDRNDRCTALEALAVKLLDRNFNLVVVGELRRGKSTLINALLGRNLLPTGVPTHVGRDRVGIWGVPAPSASSLRMVTRDRID